MSRELWELEAKGRGVSRAERRKRAIAERVHSGAPLRSSRRAHPDNMIGRNAATHGLGVNYSAGRERRFERMFGTRKFT